MGTRVFDAGRWLTAVSAPKGVRPGGRVAPPPARGCCPAQAAPAFPRAKSCKDWPSGPVFTKFPAWEWGFPKTSRSHAAPNCAIRAARGLAHLQPPSFSVPKRKSPSPCIKPKRTAATSRDRLQPNPQWDENLQKCLKVLKNGSMWDKVAISFADRGGGVPPAQSPRSA